MTLPAPAGIFSASLPCRDQHGFADAVEGDPVLRRQRLHAADAQNDVMVDADSAPCVKERAAHGVAPARPM